MRLTLLKPARVVISLAVFFLTVYLFVDYSGKLTHELTRGILLFQFVPSLVTLFHAVNAAAAGFVAVLLLTLLFGRVYCSFLCPLGVLQDLFTGLRTRIRRKKRLRYLRPNPWLRYGFLALAIVPLFAGSLFFLGLLDPYSLSGKIFSGIFRPVYYAGNNLLVWVLGLFNAYPLYPVEMKYISIPSLIFTLAIFLFFILIAFFKGRWYCNTVCPVGTVLGLVSKVSLFKIHIEEEGCTSCGLCARVCKGGCIEMKSKTVDFSRCVACYNCFRACTTDSFRYSISRSIAKPKSTDSRRSFLKQTAAGITGMAGLLAAKNVLADAQQTTKDPKPGPVTPPGSLSIWNFTSACTACHLCISSCPTKVLQPSFFEYGLEGLFLPKMNYAANYCNFDCVACTTVCPTEALRQLTVEQKHRTQIGVSKFIKNICVVVEKKTACGACSEHCPTKAVEMVPYLGTLKIPQVDEKICVGCGACEHACPTRPIRAIYVEPLSYHRVAMKPLKKVNAEPGVKKVEEDFPF